MVQSNFGRALAVMGSGERFARDEAYVGKYVRISTMHARANTVRNVDFHVVVGYLRETMHEHIREEVIYKTP